MWTSIRVHPSDVQAFNPKSREMRTTPSLETAGSGESPLKYGTMGRPAYEQKRVVMRCLNEREVDKLASLHSHALQAMGFPDDWHHLIESI